MIALRTIDEENFEACIRLVVNVEEEFVDSVLYSLAEAWLYRDCMEVFAIYHTDQPIGFVSMYVGRENPQIINFLIDDAFQGLGYGTQAAALSIHYLQEKYQATRISLPVHVQNIEAQRFWMKQGFHLSDNIENGYLFMRRE
ncbi:MULTISPECIES: GNAT family N-acetyltransferase [unclassified Streptococcus]|uniref:GNAT family N-acetyltransferase n=1 Tax=unclassified Streptococcus TaxID=2608887 RepID=UPI001072CA33|nr:MULTISPECIES: GNAT family N-acetyltransferase [unclassified Streptococcus]MBF0787666.1 GNAT family N-acetyltransferase [Streptococcus sp. 19428wC2_LYSM12]MCQ9212238.1 GNAT family N-acetyltransferase [Streptococcus sp. B01]MCQ9213569.1 GNAT family N-acetyltransferase [Streptococcus sp. O1]TFV05387.1 GNAT family N-acetyltransferase [Streptococcus sp. LYSM12]